MPPPPHIESLLSNAVQFILSQLMALSTTLFATNGGRDVKGGPTRGGSTRGGSTRSTSSYVATLIGQLRILHLSYPSSGAIPLAVNRMLEECVNCLGKLNKSPTDTPASDDSIHNVKFLTLCYAALSCGAKFEGGDKLNCLISTCRTILGLELSIPNEIRKEAKQSCRSIFQYAKW